MAVVGMAIGALASALGYGFFILTISLIVQLWFVRWTTQMALGVKSWAATKYVLPAFLFVTFATGASYIFSIEKCGSTGRACKRVFFERLCTPSYLKPPTI